MVGVLIGDKTKADYAVRIRGRGSAVSDVRQTTIREAIGCAGIGLHSGTEINMTLLPAPADSGITFVRTDLAGLRVPARYDLVAETRLGTTLVADNGARVATVEHLMAALWGCGIDNIVVELDGDEVPVMDGSSEPFVFLIDCAGIETLAAKRREIRILRPVVVERGDKRIALYPDDAATVCYEIAFDNPVIGHQSLEFVGVNGAFRDDLARARTFGFEADVAAMHAAGLARGGSLENAIVVGDEGVLNEDGLRFTDEFVRHKVLDCLGDLYLAGSRLIGRVEATRAGHEMNNALLRAVFADADNWCYEDANEAVWPESPAAVALG